MLEVLRAGKTLSVTVELQSFAGLAKLGDEWGSTRPQDDAVTFVVLRMI